MDSLVVHLCLFLFWKLINYLVNCYSYTRAVHKLLRQRKLKGTWKRYKLDFTWLETSTLFFSTCKISIIWLRSTDRREHKKSITWRYAEHSDVANVTSAGYNGVNAIVTASLLPNIHTIQFNALHMTLNPLILYICSVNIWSADATEMLFQSTIPLTVCQAPCYSEFNTFNVKLSVITVCLTVIF